MAGIIINSVSMHFDNGVDALANINLNIPDARIFGISGAKGSGKSTLLRIIAGILMPTEGKVEFSQSGGRVSLILPHSSLFPGLTLSDNLGLAEGRSSCAKGQTRIDDIAKLTGISELMNEYPSGLTSEQNFMGLFAKSLLREPDVLLIDDPLRDFEAGLASRIFGRVAEIQKQLGLTLVVATAKPEILRYSDDSCALFEGKMENGHE